jgi:cyclomaltodextrinase
MLMHHPGPPRFVAVGDEVELAPRDPDPTERYRWELRRTPAESAATLGDDPVEHLVPDVPGTYVAGLSAPDGDHEQTIRALPGGRSPPIARRSGYSGEQAGEPADPPGHRSGAYAGATGTDADEGPGGRPRLTLTPTVEDGEAVVRADPEAHPHGSETAADLDVEFLVDDRDDVDPAAVTRTGDAVHIPVGALADPTRIHAVALGEHGYSVPAVVEFSPGGDGDVDASTRTVETTNPYHPPDWAEDSVVYEIYVRTFSDGDGSAFDAITDRLEYIDSLGVDVIWLTPVLENDHAPHGYNITDFFDIAADLGDRADYERFIDAAHEQGLRVLFDLVCNHSARTHPHFQAAVADTDSEYRDWYEWRSETDPETYFDWEHIANFNFDHLPVRRHLLDFVDEWEPLVDGFRCDMAWAVPNSFWRELHDRCKDGREEFLLLDETIPYIPDFQAGLFDMHFDSTTYHTLRQIGTGQDARSLVDAIHNRTDIGFPDYAGFLLYLENHDETRYIVECGRAETMAAAGALFTLPGAPLIYAGQEFGQRGRRDALAWEHADEPLRDHVRTLAAAREEQPALSADADFAAATHTVQEGSPDRVVAYRRATDEEAVVVVLNFEGDPATVTVPDAAGTTDLVTDEPVGASGESGTTVTVDSVVVLPASTVD